MDISTCQLDISTCQQAPTLLSELTYYAGQVVNEFDLPYIFFDLPEISYNIC